MEANRLNILKSWQSRIFASLVVCVFSAISHGEEAQDDETQWLSSALDAVIADKPLPKDTAQVWAEIQRRLQWGQNDIRLFEAQGRLAYKQGRWLEALAALQKISDPSPAVMEILAECLNSKGEKYEAAALMLKAARIHGPSSAKALRLFQNYLAVRQDDISVQAEFAGILARQGKLVEAARIYRDHPEAFIDSVGAAFEAGKALEAQNWGSDALKLYVLALGRHPKGEVLAKRASAILKSMTGTPVVAEHWQKLWELFPLDTLARNHALSVWESIRDVSHYRALLEQALRQDSVSPFLALHGMRDAKTRGDRGAMKRFAAKAAKSGSCTSDCAVILAETLDGDAEISKYLGLFLNEAKSPKPSPALLQAVARGLALQGKYPDACTYYEKAHAEDSRILEGRTETLEDLSHCEQPSALGLLAKLGGATSGNSAVIISLAREAWKEKKWADLSKLLVRLASQPSVSFTGIWPMAEALAQSSQAGGDSAIPILKNLAMAKGADTVAVAVLLGKLYFERKRCDEALPQLKTAHNAGQGGEDKLAECWKQKGNKKEAAYWTLRAARAQGPESNQAPPLYLAYLEYHPGDPAALTELAAAYQKQGKVTEEAAVYKTNPGVFIDSESVAKMAGSALEAQKFMADAAGLYARALEKNPKSEALADRLSALLPGLEISAAAGRWQRLWELFPSDTVSRNHALLSYEAGGDSTRYRSLLEKSLRQDSLSPWLNRRAALSAMERGDKKAARKHAGLAVKGNRDSATVSILAMTASNDGEIKTHLDMFISESRSGKPSAPVLRAAARGLSLLSSDEACVLYEKAYAASPAVLQGKSEVLEDLSRCPDASALSVLNKLGGSNSSNPQVVLVLSREALREKKWDELKNLLERAVNQPKAPLKELWPMARELAYAKPGLANTILKKMSEAGDVEAATFYGRILHDGKKCSEALPHLAAVLIAGKGVEEMVGHCQLETGDTAGAKRTYEKFYERTKDPLALRVLANLGARKLDVNAEIWALSLLNEGNMATTNEKIRLGLLMHDKGEYDKSGALLDEALRQEGMVTEPDIAMASLHAGLWAMEKNKMDRALRHLGNATRLLPDLPVGWKTLGEAQIRMGNWAEAGKAFSRGSELAPADSGIASGLMSAAKKSGDRKLLEKGYAAMLRIDTNLVEANRFFSELYPGVKKCREALPFLQRLTQYDPKDGKTWARFGNCLMETSNFSLAGSALQTALDLGIDDDEVFLNRAMVYQKEGAKDMAESILSFVLSRSPKNEKARALQAELKK